MIPDLDFSENEIETLIFKAARGGGLALGFAEDLAAAARYLDLAGLTRCPCAGSPSDVARVQTALDFCVAGQGSQTVAADAALIEAFVAVAQIAWNKHLIWTATPTGAVFDRFEDTAIETMAPQGRRKMSAPLLAHLSDMAAKLLVPETEASRQSGAGAGLSDTD